MTDGVPATWALHVCYGNRYARQSWEGHYDFLFPAVKAARAVLDFAAIARKVICDIGYDTGDFGFDGNAVGVITALDRQSPDIARGVTELHDARAGSTDPFDSVGAGDQGMMFGYASNETPELMPMPIVLAHKLARRLAEVRRNGLLPYLRPDGKTQVTVRYEEGKPVGVEKVLISTQHADGVEPKLADALWEQVVTQVLPPGLYDAGALRKEFYVNPTGRFVIGGPVGDTGLTGRKIIVDTYGGFARHGGGAFSGKDPSKVDRSASYAARHVAKNIVAAGLAARAEVQVAYAIGVGLRSPCSSRPSALRRSAGPPSPTWCETISTCGPPPW